MLISQFLSLIQYDYLGGFQSFLLNEHDGVMNNTVAAFPRTRHGNFSKREISGVEAMPLFDCSRCIFQSRHIRVTNSLGVLLVPHHLQWLFLTNF